VGIRETLNDNPRLTTGITAGIIVVVFVLIFWSGGGSAGGGGGSGGGGTRVFFSDDDGKTWFPDDYTKVPPFQHNGKEAVRAWVYKCGGKTFVNHLERYTPEAKKKVEELNSSKKMANDPTMIDQIQRSGMEVKSPGDPAWVKAGDAKASKVTAPKCPDGGKDLELVTP
jgi:hypothetical protein